jgi:hypothetical protein
MRHGVSAEVGNQFLEKVIKGQFDDDLDNLAADLDEDIVEGPLAMWPFSGQHSKFLFVRDCGCGE